MAIWSVMEPSLGIMAGCLATMRPLFKGFGIGHSPSRAYLEKYVPVSSKLARSAGESSRFRIIKLGECVSPSITAVGDTTLSPRLRGGAAYPDNSISGPLDACTSPIALQFLRPTMKTDIFSNRDSITALQKEELSSQSISVHTTIRTSSIYEDIEPPREEQ